jgi:tetratricopeptide (TPR) repeat protein
MSASRKLESFRFDVAFSFAGPHRDKVRAIAEIVAAKLGKKQVFFDELYRAEILGGNMRVLLQRIYGEKSLMVVADLSNDYADRPWCQGEAEAIDALRMRIDSARDETARLRVFIVRFGPGNVPSVLENTGWLDGINLSPREIADVILERIQLLKERIVEEQSVTTQSEEASTTPTTPAPPILFFHPATNDDCYSRREKELKWLDDCAKDAGIRIATVTGQGGLGKTSLVGHWIEKHRGWQHRAFRGVFFYSFYSNRDAKAFFTAFLNFVCEVERVRELPKEAPLHHLAAMACRRWSYLVVLDGLEALQHSEDDPHYGWIADSELTEFVARVGAESASLLVLTSRFPFPRITDEHPAAARALELLLFTKAEGADLLAVCGLTDLRPRLEGYCELLGGHPLALRIFAGACLEQPFDKPEKVSAHVCSAQDVETMPDPDESGLSPEESQKRWQRRQFYKLLRWFQQKLTPPKRRLLQLVALFRNPVRTDTLVALACGLEAMKADFANCDAARITGLLDQLSGQFLLHKETSPEDATIHWTAHPIVRDIFREAALASGDTVAKQFAEIVAGKRGESPKTVAEVLPIVEAIEVLLAAGDFEAAHDLYQRRLESGWVFLFIPAPQEGLRCARAFLEIAKQRPAWSLGMRSLGFWLNEMALWASLLGEMEGVVRGYSDSNQFEYMLDSWHNVSTGFQNIADAQILCGSLSEAVASASEAIFYAGAVQDSHIENAAMSLSTLDSRTKLPARPSPSPKYNEKMEVWSRPRRAHALSLRGRLATASHDFAATDALSQQRFPEYDGLHGILSVWWSRHRLRLGEPEAARRLTEANRAICDRNGWNDDFIRCELLLGELDLLAGNISFAKRRIAKGLRVFRDAHQGRDLPDALLAMARVRWAVQLAQKNARRAPARPAEFPSAFTGDESALSHCEESLRLAAHSGFLLKKCDALNFRAQLLRESGQPDKALADAKQAHDIAQRCDYYWGIHEAVRQLRDTAKSLNRTAEFREWDKAERDLTKKMQPKIAAALEINRQHDAKMERLYGVKKMSR